MTSILFLACSKNNAPSYSTTEFINCLLNENWEIETLESELIGTYQYTTLTCGPIDYSSIIGEVEIVFEEERTVKYYDNGMLIDQAEWHLEYDSSNWTITTVPHRFHDLEGYFALCQNEVWIRSFPDFESIICDHFLVRS